MNQPYSPWGIFTDVFYMGGGGKIAHPYENPRSSCKWHKTWPKGWTKIKLWSFDYKNPVTSSFCLRQHFLWHPLENLPKMYPKFTHGQRNEPPGSSHDCILFYNPSKCSQMSLEWLATRIVKPRSGKWHLFESQQSSVNVVGKIAHPNTVWQHVDNSRSTQAGRLKLAMIVR